jgi:glycosyltransferase involved in cell wall biosynthesis
MLRIGLATTMGDNAPSYHLRFRSVLSVLQNNGKVQSCDMVRKSFFGRSVRFSPGDETDVILVARVRNLDLLKSIFDFAGLRGVPVIYETDDHLLYDRRSDAPGEHSAEVSAYLKRSACIIASTPYLADELRPYNDRVFVFPNLLDPEVWDIRRPVAADEGRPLRICCIGTGLMAENLSLMVPAMEHCAQAYGRDVIFSLWGNEKYLDQRVRKLKNVTITGEKMPYRKFARQLRTSNYTFGVVPLSDLRFNRAKSNIKYLEYAASGIPSIFSRVEAYAGLADGETCLLSDNDPDAWKQAIIRMIEDKELRRRCAQNAFRHVKETFVLNETWAARYASILEACCGR